MEIGDYYLFLILNNIFCVRTKKRANIRITKSFVQKEKKKKIVNKTKSLNKRFSKNKILWIYKNIFWMPKIYFFLTLKWLNKKKIFLTRLQAEKFS